MAGDGLSASSGAFAVGVDDSSIETNSDALRVKASGITNAMLAGSIAISKLAENDITIAADSGTSHAIDLGETLTVSGTANEVETSISNNTLTIGLPNNVTIGGNLTVSGTTTTVDSTTVAIADSMLKLAKDQANDADALDFGVYGQYGDSGTHKYAGIFRDVSATGDPFTFFDSLQAEPGTTVDTSGTGYDLADISAGAITAADGLTGTLQTAAQGNVTSLGTLTTLTVDNVRINGTTIGHTDDTDLITLADGVATVAGELSVTTLDIGGTDITTTAAEINLIDGGTSRTTNTVVHGDGFLHNNGGTMEMTNVSSLATLFAGSGLTATNSVIAVDTLNQDTTGTAALAEGLTGTPNISVGTIAATTITASTAIALGDDDPIKLGANTDAYIVHDAGALSADAETPDWVEGTSDHLGYAADSLVISNVTDDADIAFFVSDGGHSRGVLKLNGDDGNIYTGGGADLKGEGAATSSITGFTLDGGSF
jgi:hypothetical protein